MRRVRVGDVLELQRRPVEIDPATEYTLIGIYSFGKGIFHRPPQLGVDLGDYSFSEVRPGDLVMSNIQAWEGAIGFATAIDTDTIGTHRFLSYSARDPEEIDTNWARYYFLSAAGFPSIQRAAPGSVTRNRTLARERFEAIEIPLPDIDEQRCIAATLDRVRDKVAQTERRRSAVSLKASALTASLAAQPHLGDADRLGAGWRRLPLGEVMAQAADVIDVTMDGEYPNLGIFSFGRGVFEKPPIVGLSTSAKKLNRVRAGEFIYSRLFAFEGAYAFVPDEFDGYYVSNEFPSFRVDPSITSARFVASALRSPDQWAELAGSSKGLGLRRQRIQVEALLAHEIWFPPLHEQQRVVAGLDKLDQLGTLLDRSNELATAVYPAALNRAFAGMA